ncbi:hypothetical protein EYR40_004923 [Pleurotus pulmonarius]|nr:hypothetical protein EYR40_004923 [Pleurotus pulmonarius]
MSHPIRSRTLVQSPTTAPDDLYPPPGPPPRSRTLTILSGVNTVVDPMFSNPSLQTALSILDQLADLGRTLPFVAPAFILLKIIVEVENNARDVDLKCTDLLDRINFMLGHLPQLQKVTVTEATRQVIDRMNGVLKQAAALIETYRSQGRVSRRLALGNKEKFLLCAQNINTCINDLMISLQIHQTTQLDAIVNRAIPSDPEDDAAQKFIASHGGVNVVKESRELVKQFADTLEQGVDDQTMEQLNMNLSDTIHDNQVELEKKINATVSEAILDGLKDIAAQMKETDKEQKFVCVQCNEEYRASANGPASCSFHRADPWNRNYPCCGSQHPCTFKSHRANHHCEYAYNNFFKRAWGIINYTDTCDNFAQVEDTNLETNEKQKAYVGQLLRWASRGERVQDPTLLIRVGSISWKEKYFFHTFTAKELLSLSEVINITHQCTIFRTSSSEKEYAMAEWLLSRDGVINAVRLTAKVETSDLPFVSVCPIDINTCTKSSEIVVLSEGGLRSYTPRGEYRIPPTVRVSATLTEKPLRVPRTFKTVTSPSLPVVLKVTSDPPLTANAEYARNDIDYFEGIVSIVNKSPVNGGEPVTLESITATFRLVGDEEYAPVASIKVINEMFPLTVDPRQARPIRFLVEVPRPEADKKMDIRWWNRAYIARSRPLRLKLTVADLEGEEASVVCEYVFTPYSLDKPKPESEEIAFFHFDDDDRCNRPYIRVSPSTRKDTLLEIDGNEVTTTKLQQIVWSALKSGDSEIELGMGNERAGGDWEWKAWALVDINCRRVYALKVLLNQGPNVSVKKYACLGYVPCPPYGGVLRNTRQIRHATEKVLMPALSPIQDVNYPTDDALDDYVPPPAATPAPTSGGSAGASAALPADVSARLTSIDSNLSRIAFSLEKLVEMLSATQGVNGQTR